MKRLVISEHAILRFAERALALDRAPIERAIRAAVGKHIKGRFKLADLPLVAEVVDGVVVTVAPDAPTPKSVAKRAKRRERQRAKEPIVNELHLNRLLQPSAIESWL